MSKLDKVVLYLGLGFGIILQWFAIHHTGIEAREFLGLMALVIFLVLIIFLVGIAERKFNKK